MTLLEKTSKRFHYLDFTAMIFAFIIIISGMGFSWFLIEKGQNLTGSIFAGGTIILAANSFLNFKKNNQDTSPKD